MDPTPIISVDPIFFDYFSSTPLLKEVADHMVELIRNPKLQANPSSLHPWGRQSNALIEEARTTIIKSLHLPSNPLIFTASSTESIHLAILGAIEAYPRPSHHILTWAIEHAATHGAMERARSLYGAQTHVLSAHNGLIDFDALEDVLKATPIFLISLSWVQHELGIINDWKTVYKLAKKYGALLHLDASQAIGKLPVTFDEDCPDYITLPSHKCFGPKGIAALYVASHRHRRVKALISGGGQQFNLRSGTEPTALISSMAKAYELISKLQPSWYSSNQAYQQQLLNTLRSVNIFEIGHEITHRVPQVLTLHIPESKGSLWRSRIMSSHGSACGHQQGKLSSTLLHLNIPRKIVAESYRVSWCHLTAPEEIQSLSELWQIIFQDS